MKIFIDPGHGGEDPGAVAKSGLRECDVNLDTAKKLDRILQRRGYTTKMSRTTDVFVSLSNRAKMANDWGADYFISVHCNSATNTTATGVETLFYRINTKSEALANDVQVQLVLQTGFRDRGIKQRNIAVLRLTNMPAILTEQGFLSNPAEAKIMGTESFQLNAAQGIADGLTQFIK